MLTLSYTLPLSSCHLLKDGMGLLQVHSDRLKLDEGESEFLSPIYAEEIHSREVPSSLTHSSGSSSHILLLSINRILPHLSPSSSTPLSWSFSQSSRSSGCSSQPAVDFWTFVRGRVRANALAVPPSARGAGALSLPINLQDVCGSL